MTREPQTDRRAEQRRTEILHDDTVLERREVQVVHGARPERIKERGRSVAAIIQVVGAERALFDHRTVVHYHDSILGSASPPSMFGREPTVRNDLREDRLCLVPIWAMRRCDTSHCKGGLPKRIVGRVVAVCCQLEWLSQLPSRIQ